MHYVVRSTLLGLFLVGAAVPASAQPETGGGDRLTGPDYARSPVIAEHGIAATSQPLASQIAVNTLQKGGSAVDAAIAANAALGLMEPTGGAMEGRGTLRVESGVPDEVGRPSAAVGTA